MAPHAASGDDTYPDSSPDPLAMSFNEIRMRSRRAATRTTKQPLASTSPSKQNRKPDVQEFEISSPSKQMVLSTPRTGGASPWRIKVTVEAEPEGSDENATPTVKRYTRTKTTTVPLKDPDNSSPVKRPRGRPRKSDTAPAAKRNGTPVRKRSTSKTRRPSIGADAHADQEQRDAPPKRKRGRPRKSIQRPAEDEASQVIEEAIPRDLMADPAIFEDMDETTIDKTQKLDDIPAANTYFSIPTKSPSPNEATSLPLSGSRKSIVIDPEKSLKSTPARSDLSNRLKARRSTPVATRKTAIEISSDSESDEESSIDTPSGTDEEPLEVQARSLVEFQNIPANNGMHDDEFEPEPAMQDDEADYEVGSETCYAFEEGATRMPDDTTVIDSENFSMISVDSLPSSGGLTSPINGPTGRTPSVTAMRSSGDPNSLQVLSAGLPQGRRPTTITKSSPVPQQQAQPPTEIEPCPQVVPLRYITPSMEPELPSAPPPIEPAPVTVLEAQTPKIGPVVKAGVALQGVVDPNRATPEASRPAVAKDQPNHFDDLFRGFSERTRKELRKGLQLGEQLCQEQRTPETTQAQLASKQAHLGDLFNGLSERARRELRAGYQLGEQLSQQSESSNPSSSLPSSPIKAKSIQVMPTSHTQEHEPRLPTPENQDQGSSVTVPTDVQYPALPNDIQQSHLLSPASSPEREENEMSWRVDTPPVHVVHQQEKCATGVSAFNRRRNRGTASQDIWEEEASESSNSPEADDGSVTKPTQSQGSPPDDLSVRPARGKLPRTWRRKSTADFQYSDEAEGSQEPTPPSTESDEPSPPRSDNKGKGKAVERVVEEALEAYDDAESDGSDDTGLFFQSNMPNLFNKRRSAELRMQKIERCQVSVPAHDESLLPESSPPVPVLKTPLVEKPNLFLNTPPHFPALRNSPIKSSPLRQELRMSSTPHGPSQHQFEESTLPLAPSSPFHTEVDSMFVRTVASDQQQILQEMGATDSSLRRIRDEADDYLEAYEPQERTLDEIEEMTEPSRTWNRATITSASTPAGVKQSFEESMVKPKRAYAPLFVNETPADASSSTTLLQANASKATKALSPVKVVKPKIAVAPRDAQEQTIQPTQASGGMFSRLTSTVWSAFGGSPQPSEHHVLEMFDHLPKVEPWTKTHYKTLDALFQLHKKQPKTFLPDSTVPGDANTALLTHFLRMSRRPFVGARYEAWGYKVTFTESLVVLCAAYMQLLTLKDISDYEEKSGKEIQIGDCGPGVTGERISEEEVVRRLASVIMGEKLRRDEKRGKKINRSGTMGVVWPQ